MAFVRSTSPRKQTLPILAVLGLASIGLPPRGIISTTRLRAEDVNRKAAAAPAEVIAIGDVHGDLPAFRALLHSSELIDKQGRWSGGTRVLVQTGDLLDRGPASRGALDLLMGLEKEAKDAGGRVEVLLGNHEVMNIIGDLRYATREEFAAFQEEEKPEERARRKKEILALVSRGSPLLLSKYYRELAATLDEKSFDERFPPGYFGHRGAFAPAGRYGGWLLDRKTIHREGRTIFLHGGLSPRFGSVPIDEMNRQVRRDILEYLEILAELEKLEVFDRDLGMTQLLDLFGAERQAGGPRPELRPVYRRLVRLLDGVAFSEQGPQWYRGLALEDERVLAKALERILGFHDADRIVIGHTPTTGLNVEGRFGNRVIVIDTGMNAKAYGGSPYALLLSPDGKFRVLE